MALQNIGAGNKDDAFYRYKMPRMITKIEGRGNGIKTNVVNMVDIAKALGRPASYTTKYFGCELGAQSKFDEKTGTSHVNGAHETSKLAGLLENFIKKYVQCYGCGNPETEIVITKAQMITLKCIACGFVSDVDMRDKLTTFIIKNPPEKKGAKDKKAMRRAEKERLKEGEAVDDEQKKLKKEVVKKKSMKDQNSKALTKKKPNVSDEDRSPSCVQADDDNEDESEDEDDGIQWQTDTSAEAARQRVQEQLSNVTAGMVMLSTNDEKQSSGKNSPAREEKSKSNGEKPNSGKNSPAREEKSKPNGHSNGVSKTNNNPHEMLVVEIKEYLVKGPSTTEFKNFMGTLSGTPQQAMNALFEALFDGIGKGFSKEAIKKKNYLAVAAEEESQLVLLEALEGFCGKAKPEAVKEVALVLKGLYDNDVLEEEFIVEWYEKGSSGSNKGFAMWKYVKPFIEWLQNAESETEDE